VGVALFDQWAEEYLAADELEQRMVAAAVRCVARWGLAKTSLDDIAREAGSSRATAYRVFPGGKDRWVDTVVRHEVGRLFREAEDELGETTTLEELLCGGVTIALRMLTEHEALTYMLRHEPELVLPHFAFHRLDRLFMYATELSRPHLARFLPDDDIAPAAELVARVVLSYAFRPSDAVDHRDPDSIRRLVRTYLLPALTPGEQP
jgi:AcrR family transcriptional regulator